MDEAFRQGPRRRDVPEATLRETRADAHTRTAVSGIVLAGGRSRRMGCDKGRLQVRGSPMLAIALDLAASIADELILSCRPGDLPEQDLWLGRSVRVVCDQREGGPLAGLEAALAAAGHELAIVLPIDMPELTTGMLSTLVYAGLAHPDAQAAVFVTERGLTPMPALFRRSILPVLSEQLDAGALRVGDLLARLDRVAVALDPITSPERAFLNVNTAADLARAEERGS
jgi:molybdenum cofactor guanylyltransferase